jgi:hypothetical protein
LSLAAEERQQLGRRATAHIAERFTSQVMCAGTIRVYEELLSRDRQETSTMSVAGALLTA